MRKVLSIVFGSAALAFLLYGDASESSTERTMCCVLSVVLLVAFIIQLILEIKGE